MVALNSATHIAYFSGVSAATCYVAWMSGDEHNPYAPPSAVAAPRHYRTWRSMWFSFDGRISRSQYWINGVVLRLIATIFAAIGLGIVLGVTDYLLSDDVSDPVGGVVVILFGAVYLWSELAVSVKRLHDRDYSGWWVLGYFVPIVNVWIYISVCFLAGTRGPNRFGDDPVQPFIPGPPQRV